MQPTTTLSKNSHPRIKNPPRRAVFHGSPALQLGTCSHDGVGHFKLLEVFDELRSQFFGSRVVGILVSPGVARVEQVGLDTGNGCWHVQVDDVQVLGFGVGDGTALNGSNYATGGRDVETLADTVAAAGPAGVDQ